MKLHQSAYQLVFASASPAMPRELSMLEQGKEFSEGGEAESNRAFHHVFPLQKRPQDGSQPHLAEFDDAGTPDTHPQAEEEASWRT